MQGNPTMALTELDREPNEQFREGIRPQVLDALDRATEADRALATYEVKYASVAPSAIGAVYATRKDVDRAFTWLDRAYRQHDPQLPLLRSSPDFRNLRSDPRYKGLLKKLNLPE